jgi:hypothetical protein
MKRLLLNASAILVWIVMASQTSVAQNNTGDENWDDRFAMPGVDGSVQAIAISGSEVYVGGEFATAGRAYTCIACKPAIL